MPLIRSVLLALTLAMPGVAMAAESGGEPLPPDQLVKQTTNEVLDALKEKQEAVKNDPTIGYDLIREIVLPHFDFPLMTRLVLAQHGRNADPQKIEQFREAFRKLLIRTYGTALSQYSGQTVEFLPMQSDPSRGRVVVESKIEQADGPPVNIAYRLHETDDGWKVFDVVVEGSSWVQTYRSEYGSLIRNEGLDGLIERLEEKNRTAGQG